MREVNLLASLPKSKRDIDSRCALKTPSVIATSREFGFEYFDGPREYGYGGYKYDGRWVSVAKEIINHFSLRPGNRILDVGCAKGFLVKDLLLACPGLEVFGVDISTYALKNCEKDVVGRLHLGNAICLPFPDGSFDAVVSINTLHNLNRNNVIKALKEINRLAPGKGFIQVDSYLNEVQKEKFEAWVLTAEYHDYPSEWLKLFNEAGYTGDYFWTIVE